MATFAVQLESQPASHHIEHAAHGKEFGFPALLVTGLTLFAFLVHGYHPYAEDGGLYAAGVKRLLDPTLYPHATAFVLAPMKFSLFAPAVAGIARAVPVGPERQLHTSLPIVLLALHLASIWATLFAAWMLAARCWTTREARAGAVALLACWLGLPVAGTALLFMDPYLTARSFATPCMVMALVGALDMSSVGANGRRWRGLAVWLGSIALAVAMHPLIAAYAFGATLMLICVRSTQRRVRVWGVTALSVSALGFAALSEHLAKPESAQYLRIAATRTYWFPASWRWYELAGLGAPLAIMAVLAWGRRRQVNPLHRSPVEQRRTALAQMAFLAGATSCGIAALFARADAATHLVARTQPLRMFQVVYLVMILALGAMLGESVLRRHAWRWCAALALLGGTMFVAERASFPNSFYIEIVGAQPHNLWMQAFVWIRQNTPKDALFALDADYINAPGEDAQCFRAISERSALPDYSKDGGEASIAPELTQAWAAGQAAQFDLSAPATTDPERLAALAPLGVTWVVLQTGIQTHFDCPYRNQAVKVCRIR